jgi:hypothetical protein
MQTREEWKVRLCETFRGTAAQQLRPEGPAFNSHVREGVVTDRYMTRRPEGPELFCTDERQIRD